MCGFSVILISKGTDVLKSKSLCILLNKNLNFNKNRKDWKWKIYFSSYKNRKLKVKLRWVRARERKKRAFFVPFILSEGNIFNICVLSQSIVYWIHFQNIHTFTYQKTLPHTPLQLVFKIVENLQCILNSIGIMYIKNRVSFRPNKIKNCYFKFIDWFYFLILSLSLPHSLMQYGKNEFSNTLVLAEIGLILFYVVERVTYTTSLTALW